MQGGISPTTATWVMGLFTLVGIVGQTPLPAWIPGNWAMNIASTATWVALIGNGVGTALHMVSSPAPGPMVTK